MKPLIYVAGPYRRPDPCINTHRAIQVAESIIEWTDNGVAPIVPHLTHLWHTMRPHEDRFWLDYDLEILRRCDALYRFEGESSGADDEVVEARRLDIPVLHTYADVLGWLRYR